MTDNKYMNIPSEKFEFANNSDKLHDAKFSDKPIGYFKDAFLRFRKNKASIVASIIIICIILFAIIVPFFNQTETGTRLDPYFAKMGPYVPSLAQYGIADGGAAREPNSKMLIYDYALGIGAQQLTKDPVKFIDAVTAENKYQAVLTPIDEIVAFGSRFNTTYKIRMNTYLEKGFVYRDVEKSEYEAILKFQEETGIQVLFPLIDTLDKSNKEEFTAEDRKTGAHYCFDVNSANYWYKTDSKGTPVDEKGKEWVFTIPFFGKICC